MRKKKVIKVVLFYSNHWSEWVLIGIELQYPMIARSGKYTGKRVDLENNHEAQFIPAITDGSHAQGPARRKLFHIIDGRDATTSDSVMAPGFHFRLKFHQSE